MNCQLATGAKGGANVPLKNRLNDLLSLFLKCPPVTKFLVEIGSRER